ncbi:two-component sensor histidine kinase, partial [Amycolatopsis sp. SID8362]|nr:two-component sensor histidine kinase [Amycolatopsis sp. SID8362]NED47248.1 two-component sensor histidine kinase [Amycolatopsis sp. SID8362]
MPGFVKSLLHPGGYRGLPYAVLGAVLAVPVAPFAVPWALLSPAGRPRVLLALIGLAVLLGLLGLLGPVRRFGVAVANGLLGTAL